MDLKLKANDLEVGMFYEDCSFHPLLCTVVDKVKDHVEGISLVDGRVRCCSLKHCGVRILSVREAIQWKFHGPQEIDEEAYFLDPKNAWWGKKS